MGKTAMDNKQYDVAIENFNKAGELDPGQGAVWSTLAQAYEQLAKTKTGADFDTNMQKAAESWTKAIAINPDDAGLHNNYALTLAGGKKFPEAQAELEKAATLNPAGAGQYYYNLGALEVNAGQNDAASETFKKAIAIMPPYAEAFYQYGLTLMAKATMDKDGKTIPVPGTAEAFQKYLELAPNGSHAEEAKAMLATLGTTLQTRVQEPRRRNQEEEIDYEVTAGTIRGRGGALLPRSHDSSIFRRVCFSLTAVPRHPFFTRQFPLPLSQPAGEPAAECANGSGRGRIEEGPGVWHLCLDRDQPDTHRQRPGCILLLEGVQRPVPEGVTNAAVPSPGCVLSAVCDNVRKQRWGRVDAADGRRRPSHCAAKESVAAWDRRFRLSTDVLAAAEPGGLSYVSQQEERIVIHGNRDSHRESCARFTIRRRPRPPAARGFSFGPARTGPGRRRRKRRSKSWRSTASRWRFRAGEIFGLLGPNGAGKSTTIGILTTRTEPTSGRAFVGDFDVWKQQVKAKRLIGVVPQRPNLDFALTAREVLLFHGAYFGQSARERAAPRR